MEFCDSIALTSSLLYKFVSSMLATGQSTSSKTILKNVNTNYFKTQKNEFVILIVINWINGGLVQILTPIFLQVSIFRKLILSWFGLFMIRPDSTLTPQTCRPPLRNQGYSKKSGWKREPLISNRFIITIYSIVWFSRRLDLKLRKHIHNWIVMFWNLFCWNVFIRV